MMPWSRCPATDIMMTSYSSHHQCAASRRWRKSSVRKKELFHLLRLFPQWLSGKESACPAGDVGLILGLGRSPGEGNGNPLQHSCLGNPMDRGAWRATVHGVTKRGGHNFSNWTPGGGRKCEFYKKSHNQNIMSQFFHLQNSNILFPKVESFWKSIKTMQLVLLSILVYLRTDQFLWRNVRKITN